MNDFTGAMFVQILAAIGIFILAILFATPARTQCLTQDQARQLWPKKHLYWYSKDHCWSNRRGPPSGIKVDPVPEKEKPRVSVRNYLYPIDTNGNMNGPFEDYCCWPSLDDLKALAKGVEK
jgi:hypothetical protein